MRGTGYGSDMIEWLRDTHGLVFSSGSVYPALSGLVDDGLIKVRKIVSVSNGRHPQFYELTARGRRLAEEHREIVKGLFGFSTEKSG